MRTFDRFARHAIVAVVCLLAIPQIASGQLILEPTLPVEEGKLVKFWLSEAWEKGSEQNDKSVDVYKAATPTNSYVTFAYAVNRLQHNRSTESLQAVEAAIAQDKSNIDAILFSVWLKMVRDDFDVALIEMQSFADQVKVANVKPESLKFAYRRLGRLLGYLQGPVAGQCNADILARTTERLNEGLDDDLKKVMAEQSDAVIKKYEKLLQELSQNVQNSIKKNEAANKNSQKALEKQSELLEAQSEQIKQRRDLLGRELEQRISALSQGLAPLEAELQNVVAQIDGVRSQIAYDQTALLYTQPDPQGSLLVQQLGRLQLQRNYIALRTLRGNANAIANTIQAEQNKIGQVRAAYNNELRNLTKDIKKSANLQLRNANQKVKAAEGPKPDAGAVAALNNRTSALSIYDPLPLEQYRADFLRLLPDTK